MRQQSTGQDRLPDRVGSGVAGLDEILNGGFPRDRLHLVQGAPGTGKTTLALQFLLNGASQGERVLYATLSETIDELRGVARSHGWDLDGVVLQELAPSQESLRPDAQYTILHPAEVELSETIGSVVDEVGRTKPTRVVVDSLAELQFLARDPLRYRRQILGLKQFFAGCGCTVLLLDGLNEASSGVESIAHGVLHLHQIAPEYGVERRRLHVVKMRGVRYRGGYHDFVIATGGLRVFPRLVAAEHRSSFPPSRVSSGVEEAEDAVRIRDEFLAAVAHDLKNPLAAIKGYTQLLQRRVARAGTPEGQTLAQGLATIDGMVGQAVAQLDELLDLARLQAGQRLQIDRRPTDLVALATRVADEYQRTTAQHHIRVDSAAAELVGVWDTLRLERVLGNLLSNAIKYSPAGGEIAIMVGPEERGQQTWATVTVRDHGIGIPPADLPHIFERFYRASNATGRVAGTGLGLASVRQIVEEQGGMIDVTSVEGGGSAFTIRLPIVQAARAAHPEA